MNNETNIFIYERRLAWSSSIGSRRRHFCFSAENKSFVRRHFADATRRHFVTKTIRSSAFVRSIIVSSVPRHFVEVSTGRLANCLQMKPAKKEKGKRTDYRLAGWVHFHWFYVWLLSRVLKNFLWRVEKGFLSLFHPACLGSNPVTQNFLSSLITLRIKSYDCGPYIWVTTRLCTMIQSKA